MALVLADRVKETTTTTGTGTVTLAGASAGYRSFATVGNGNTTYYTISGQTTSEWEVGIGTYTTVGTTLSRTTVLSSSNGGSLVVFSAGTKDVFVTYPAGRSVNVDAANAVVSVPQLSATSITNTGVTTVQAGTALLPAIVSTTGTADTGIWFPAADTVAASTAGTERMRLDSSGNLGLGVTPSASTWAGGVNLPILDIARSATYSIINSKAYSALSYGGGMLVLGHSKSATIGTQVATASGDTFGLISFEGVNSSSAIAGATYIYAIQDGANGVTYIPGALTFYTGTSAAAPTERMRISSAGNLGIGTTSPGSKLEVVGDIQQPNANYLKGKNFAGTATRLFGLNTADTLYIGSIDADHSGGTLFVKNGVSQMTLDSSGNLGLGVTASAWVGVKAFQLPGSSAIASSNQYLDINSNAYYGATSQYRYISASGLAAQYLQEAGAHIWKTAPASTGAGNAITFTQAMTLTSAGNLGVGTTTPASRLNVIGGSLATTGTGILAAGALNAGRLVSDGTNGTVNPIHTYFDSYAYEISAGSTSGYVTGVVVAARSFTGTGGEGVSFWTRSAERMRVDGSGNVGIGTSSPAQKLDVAGAVNSVQARFGNVASRGLEISTFFSGGTNDAGVTLNAATAVYGTLTFKTASTERMCIDSIGNVGIGTSSPVTKLNISGSSTVAGELGTLAITGSTTAKRLTFGVDSTSTMYGWIQSVENGVSTRDLVLQSLGGNVGIGTTAPVAKLDVQNANAYVRIKSTSGTYALFDIDSPASYQPIIRFLSNGIEQARIISPVNEAASRLVFTTGDSGVEKMRIDLSGNLMVGTTASTGSAANTASVVGGIFKTASGTVSAATATATTIFTCPTLETGLYLVNAQLGYNDPATYGAVSLVGVGNTTLRATSLATGTNITITVSGQTIRSTQTSGSTQTITWTVTRLS